MSEFNRSFDVGALARWDAKHSRNAVRALFNRWAMPGRESTTEAPLRLGLRNGYVNFYIRGQSVARLSIGHEDPKVSVHQAYVDGRRRRSVDHSGVPPTQNYIDYRADKLARDETTALIDGWISTAESYASAEKRFVDRLIEANAGVIDLEMGLPASDTAQGKRVAPRMDLVTAQVSGGAVSVAFWEAKCSINKELRAKADYEEDEGEYRIGPKVIHQLRKYQQWVGEEKRTAEVQKAYKKGAKTMLNFYEAFGFKDASQPECVRIWKALAASDAPEVILPPGVVIGNYCPTGHKPRCSGEEMSFARYGESFGKHRKKLTDHGIVVHEVGPDLADHRLPQLSPGVVSA